MKLRTALCTLGLLSASLGQAVFANPYYHTASYQPSFERSNAIRPAFTQSAYTFDTAPQAVHYQTYQPQQSYLPPYINADRQYIIERAKSALGVRYKYGGNSFREGLDCSSLIQYAYRGLPIKVPRVSAQQSRKSRTIPRSAVRPGDLIFFNTSGRGVSHVGIYLGDGRFIHAASGGGKVTIDDLRKRYWQKRIVKYGTYLS